MHIYSKRLNGEVHNCEVCRKPGATIQHHVGGRRYSDQAIWVHHECHMAIHNPTAYGLPSSWAYDNNYLIRRNNAMQKEKKNKTCSHPLTIFDKRLGYVRCNFCGRKVEDIKFKQTKKSKTNKMGYGDGQSAAIKEAADLKTKHDVLKVAIKKTKDVAQKAALEASLGETLGRMKKLQKENNESDY